MSASNNFILQFSARFDAERVAAENIFSFEQEQHRAKYQKNMEHATAAQERYLSFVEPFISCLSNLPDNVTIESIRRNTDQEVEIKLVAEPGLSLAILLMEYPPLPFAINSSGKMREPDVENFEDPVYSGILIEKSQSLVHWQSNIGGDIVNFTCLTVFIALDAWENPAKTGASVATVQLGDVDIKTPWQSLSQDGSDYWAQPVNAVGVSLLNDAIHWKKEATLFILLREGFNARIKNVTTLDSPQAKIVLNALFSWATSENELPKKEDFSAWTAPRGNVLAMHSPQDWFALTEIIKQEDTQVNSAQLKIHRLSERLPNIWRFADDKSVGVICEAMAETQKRWTENQPLSLLAPAH